MALDSYDITVRPAAPVTVTATMCSAPTYAVSGVLVEAEPVFSEPAEINDVSYYPGSPLVSAIGGSVASSSPFVVTGATTATVVMTSITGTYYSSSSSAVFVIPFGTTFNASTRESDVGGSPRRYKYRANFLSAIGAATAVAEQIIAGNIRIVVDTPLRVGGGTPNKACSITQV